MRAVVFLSFFLALACVAHAQHTFSIVAVDTVTGEIGSAGATCGDSVIWPGTPGAYIISTIIPGVGAIHTQAQWSPYNQGSARSHMAAGKSPEELVAWLTANDYNDNPSIRQYGVVDLRTGSPRVAAFTGANCLDYKGHVTGRNYAIQGNILLGKEILEEMEARFLAAEGTLADRLMAALQGAKVVGADSRCAQYGVSALSAFVRVARPDDREDSLTLDLNVAAVPAGVDPVDALQSRYDQWRVSSVPELTEEKGSIAIYPSPAGEGVTVEFAGVNPLPDELQLVDVAGRIALALPTGRRSKVLVDVSSLPPGSYLPVGTSAGRRVVAGEAFIVE